MTVVTVQIRCGNLTELEIATVVNHYLLPLVKVISLIMSKYCHHPSSMTFQIQEEEKATLTKSEKGAGQGAKKGGKGKK